MRLLIITQKVDRRDPILGFFIRWIVEFSKKCGQVVVIGQYAGSFDLPGNVEVFSMRKEKGYSRLRQIFEFWKLQWKLKREYDAVLVHMTPVWVVLGWPVWFIFRKPVYLWYEARGGGWALPLSLRLARKVFSATEYGLPRRAKNSVIVGHGIDTEFMKPSGIRDRNLIVAIGRITKTKHYDVILKAFAKLPSNCRLFIAGGTIRKDDRIVLAGLEKIMKDLDISNRVEIKFVTHEEIRSLLQRSVLQLHACGGGLDKCVLESMACGCPVVSSSIAAKYVLPEVCLCTEETIGEKAIQILGLPEADRNDLAGGLRQKVIEEHSLQRLAERLVVEMKK